VSPVVRCLEKKLWETLSRGVRALDLRMPSMWSCSAAREKVALDLESIQGLSLCVLCVWCAAVERNCVMKTAVLVMRGVGMVGCEVLVW